MRTITDVLTGRFAACAALAAAACLAPVDLAHAADIESVLEIERQGNAQSLESQKRIDKIDDESDAMAAEYRTTLDQIESLRVYNRQLEKLLAAQQEELDSLGDQIGNVTVIGREVTPLMLRMVDALDSFIELDVPLLRAERRERVAALRKLMDRADVEDSEKYRRIMEAYQIENEYGRTIEAYQDTLEVNGEQRTLDLLRVGRVALLYQTLDGREVGAWNQSERRWQTLPDDFRDSVRQGIRIARKQMAPDMIRLPVSAPEGSR